MTSTKGVCTAQETNFLEAKVPKISSFFFPLEGFQYKNFQSKMLSAKPTVDDPARLSQSYN